MKVAIALIYALAAPAVAQDLVSRDASFASALKASLAAEIRRNIQPHWHPPAGSEGTLLRTEVEFWLAPDGSLAKPPVVARQTGLTDANRNLAELHRERAMNAVRSAAPFSTLPAQYYVHWKHAKIVFKEGAHL